MLQALYPSSEDWAYQLLFALSALSFLSCFANVFMYDRIPHLHNTLNHFLMAATMGELLASVARCALGVDVGFVSGTISAGECKLVSVLLTAAQAISATFVASYWVNALLVLKFGESAAQHFLKYIFGCLLAGVAAVTLYVALMSSADDYIGEDRHVCYMPTQQLYAFAVPMVASGFVMIVGAVWVAARLFWFNNAEPEPQCFYYLAARAAYVTIFVGFAVITAVRYTDPHNFDGATPDKFHRSLTWAGMAFQCLNGCILLCLFAYTEGGTAAFSCSHRRSARYSGSPTASQRNTKNTTESGSDYGAFNMGNGGNGGGSQHVVRVTSATGGVPVRDSSAAAVARDSSVAAVRRQPSGFTLTKNGEIGESERMFSRLIILASDVLEGDSLLQDTYSNILKNLLPLFFL